MKRSVAPSPQVARLTPRTGRPTRWTTAVAGLLVAGLALAVPALPAAADDDDDRIIEVTADGVRFQSSANEVDVNYTVFDADFNWLGNYKEKVPGDDKPVYAAFTTAQEKHPDGYCVTHLRVERAGDWNGWGSSAKCYRPAEPTPTATPSAAAAKPTATPDPAPEQPAAAPATEAEAEAAPAPAVAEEPAPSPTPTPSPSPSASSSPTVSPSPSPSPSRGTPAALAAAQADKAAPPPVTSGTGPVAAGLGWLAVLVSGLLVAAGGTLLIARVRAQ